MIFAAIFGTVCGLGMLGQWSFSYVTGQIPELKTEPIRIKFHIAAEVTTALMLILSGLGLWFAADWGRTLYPVAAGMLFYTAIVSPGYFAQQGQHVWLVIFGILLALAIVSLLLIL